MKSTYAILLDGGFVTRKLREKLDRFPTADDVEDFCGQVSNHRVVGGLDLLRIYFYDAPPSKESLVNPISKEKLSLAKTPV